ncbi:hypothetical protein LTR85_006894 [Meristemomyces frigidus]|nr:hypothetical protein LTR85_006894 [Meristemomyces frigidus]
MAQIGPPYHIEDWQAAAAAKRSHLFDRIPKTHLLPSELAARAAKHELLPEDPAVLSCGILSSLDQEITCIEDAEVLLRQIQDRKYTKILYDQALERAAELDQHLQDTGETVGLLHGLPVSLKDCYGIKGIPVTAGLVSWIPNVATEDSSITKGLLAAGAVLYIKTNVSQAHLMVESINNVFGTTLNPYNPALSVGGSSGGEAAVVAANAAIIGTGTDGGGSIRFPAMFCGLWGLKCSKGRMPMMGMQSPGDGNESVNAGLGPMAKTVSGLELWLKAQLDCRPWQDDFTCVPMAWQIGEARRARQRLRFGVIWDDGVVRPTPPVTRALRMVVDALRSAGHSVIDLPRERMQVLHRQATSCVMKSNVQSGGYAVMKHIEASGEPVVPRSATGHPGSYLETHEVFANHMLRNRLSSEYNDLWKDFALDAILAPAVAHPAPPHGRYISNAYVAVYNMLDYVTGSIPVTKVDPALDEATQEWYNAEQYPRIEAERFPYDLGDKEMQELYTGPEVFANAPVGIQVVCRKLREEKCISIMKEIESVLAK